ncbi:hypothetical protein E3J51_02605 [Candidatus Bathyarchaeota archaeon]|nr:MAG: hypothetical protein E3J51_02605 [Candidatus Bathyarchaeota archaeon]
MRRKLMVFDIEGVLLPRNRYLIFEVGRKLSAFQFIKLLFLGLLYEVRLLSLELTFKEVYKLFQGISIEELSDAFKEIPFLPHVEMLFAKLREMGLKTAVISSGLPQILVEQLASQLSIDYAFGLELEVDNNAMTGSIKGEVIKKDGKALILRRILRQENLSPKECVVVADDRNNSSIFYQDALKIGYRPDSAIIQKSDHVITGDLLEILPIIKGTYGSRCRLPSRNESIREIIHSIGFLAAFASVYMGVVEIASLLLLMAVIYAASEFVRIQWKSIPLISYVTLNASTSSERHEFVATPIFLALGVVLSLLLFPVPVNYASIAIVTLGDSAASIFGRLFGNTLIPFNKGKSLEGSLGGFIFAFLGAACFLNPIQALIGAAAGMLVELLPLPINDNLSIPLVTGVLLTLLA